MTTKSGMSEECGGCFGLMNRNMKMVHWKGFHLDRAKKEKCKILVLDWKGRYGSHVKDFQR